MEEKKSKKEKNKGITLIALVITIIVLLILAGVVIATLSGDNGILTNANKAAANNGVAAMEEKIRLAVENAILEAKNDETQGKGVYTVDSKTVPALEYRLNEALNLTTLNNTVKEIDSKIVITDGGSTEGESVKRIVNYNEDIESQKLITVDVKSGNIVSIIITPISKTESFVGKYADIEGDGIVDGIIFADLAIGTDGSKKWGSNRYGVYTIPKETELKEYYISKTGYAEDTHFGTADVISPINGTSGKDRFYVMALKDETSKKWAPATGTDYGTIGEVDFGKGKENTATLMGKSDLTASDSGTLWAQIGTKISQGWFIPSRGEWAAFASNFEVTSANYSLTYGLGEAYWSSSQINTDSAWRPRFVCGYIDGCPVNYAILVRLAKIF